MLINTIVIAGPATEPVTLAEIKEALRIDDPSDAGEVERQNSLLEIYLELAREYVESRTGWTIHEQTVEAVYSCWPPVRGIILPRATPLIEIVSVIYKDSEGIETTWDDAQYIADTDGMPGAIVLGHNQSWPTFVAYPVSPIRIRYRAGIAISSPLAEAPAAFKVPILLLIAGMWENRESEIVDAKFAQTVATRYGVESYLGMRQWRLGNNVV